ncbi:hypothetical protein J6590_052494 [Homalodisca vitripennis]|nr:hypothetical protein J6590_052494 [Homalodisca vitripennis]
MNRYQSTPADPPLRFETRLSNAAWRRARLDTSPQPIIHANPKSYCCLSTPYPLLIKRAQTTLNCVITTLLVGYPRPARVPQPSRLIHHNVSSSISLLPRPYLIPLTSPLLAQSTLSGFPPISRNPTFHISWSLLRGQGKLVSDIRGLASRMDISTRAPSYHTNVFARLIHTCSERNRTAELKPQGLFESKTQRPTKAADVKAYFTQPEAEP